MLSTELASLPMPNSALSNPPQLDSTGSGSSVSNSPEDRKLRKAAGEFESMLLSNLWKSMKSTFAAPDDEENDPAHNTLEEWGMDALCSAVGKSGGLGIGKLILKSLEGKLAHSQNGNEVPVHKDSQVVADNLYRTQESTR